MIYWVPYENENITVKDYIDIQKIDYIVWDEWLFNKEKSILVLPKNKFLLIMPYEVLWNIDIDRLVYDINQCDGVIYFCNQFDNILDYKKYQKHFANLENVYFHMDAILDDYNEQRIVTTDLFTFSHTLNNTICYTNMDRNRDFLLTTILKTTGRRKLVDSLEQKNLLKNYIGNIAPKKQSNNWVGMHRNTDWKDGDISWDLYNCANYELVPETLYDRASFYTEKTMKPIVARIPFIVLSNKRFYKSLHNTGFETFGDLIDESFSCEPDLDKRINGITDTMLALDPQEFYRNSREICEHNYNNLCVQHYRSKQRFKDQLHEFLSQKG